MKKRLQKLSAYENLEIFFTVKLIINSGNLVLFSAKLYLFKLVTVIKRSFYKRTTNIISTFSLFLYQVIKKVEKQILIKYFTCEWTTTKLNYNVYTNFFCGKFSYMQNYAFCEIGFAVLLTISQN